MYVTNLLGKIFIIFAVVADIICLLLLNASILERKLIFTKIYHNIKSISIKLSILYRFNIDNSININASIDLGIDN